MYDHVLFELHSNATLFEPVPLVRLPDSGTHADRHTDSRTAPNRHTDSHTAPNRHTNSHTAPDRHAADLHTDAELDPCSEGGVGLRIALLGTYLDLWVRGGI